MKSSKLVWIVVLVLVVLNVTNVFNRGVEKAEAQTTNATWVKVYLGWTGVNNRVLYESHSVRTVTLWSNSDIDIQLINGDHVAFSLRQENLHVEWNDGR